MEAKIDRPKYSDRGPEQKPKGKKKVKKLCSYHQVTAMNS